MIFHLWNITNKIVLTNWIEWRQTGWPSVELSSCISRKRIVRKIHRDMYDKQRCLTTKWSLSPLSFVGSLQSGKLCAFFIFFKMKVQKVCYVGWQDIKTLASQWEKHHLGFQVTPQYWRPSWWITINSHPAFIISPSCLKFSGPVYDIRKISVSCALPYHGGEGAFVARPLRSPGRGVGGARGGIGTSQ